MADPSLIVIIEREPRGNVSRRRMSQYGRNMTDA